MTGSLLHSALVDLAHAYHDYTVDGWEPDTDEDGNPVPPRDYWQSHAARSLGWLTLALETPGPHRDDAFDAHTLLVQTMTGTAPVATLGSLPLAMRLITRAIEATP